MSIVIIALVIGFIILIHEAGHFIGARMGGIPVERFSIGFGPKLFSRRSKGTEFRISALPLGGYVLPAVEDEEEFFAYSPSKRILFSLAGPMANLIAAVILLAVISTATNGLSLYNMFVEPLRLAGITMVNMVTAIPTLFESPDKLSGIVGIVSEGARFTEGNILRLLQFSVLINLNLAILNLLPLPALDGGKALLYLLEGLHPRLRALQMPLSLAGWFFIIGLMVYVTVLDVARIVL